MLGLARGELAMCPGEGARYEAGALGLEGMLMAGQFDQKSTWFPVELHEKKQQQKLVI